MSFAKTEISSDLPQCAAATGRPSATQRLLLSLPCLLVIVLFAFSPNFQLTSEKMRSDPLGGDFLQEWTAGKILWSAHSTELYELSRFRAVQHDAELVGFSWPESKYFPPVYPPFYYLLMSPFSWLPYSVAVKLWAILSAIFLVVSAELMRRFYRPFQARFEPAFVVSMIFVPLWVCFNLGHKSTLLLLLLTATFLLLRHQRRWQAGLVYGLLAFKPHLAAVIGVTMLLKRQWRFVGGAAITFIVLGLISLGCGWQANLGFFNFVLNSGNYLDTAGYQLADAHSLWGATAYLFGGSGPISEFVALIAATIVVSLLTMMMRGPLKTNSTHFEFQFAAMIVSTLLLSPHLYFYDLLVVLLPMLLIACNLQSSLLSRPLAIALRAAIALFLLGAGLFLTISTLTGIQLSVVLMIAVLVLLTCADLNRIQHGKIGSNSL